MAPIQVKHNSALNRFEASVDGRLSTLEYEHRGNSVALTHTNVPQELSGRGIASELTKAALEYAQGAEMPVIPECGFVVAYLKRNPQYLNIVDSAHRTALETHQKGKNEGGLAA